MALGHSRPYVQCISLDSVETVERKSKLAVSLAIHIPECKGPFFQRDVVSMEEPLTVRSVSRDEAQSADPPHEGEEGRELTRLEGGSINDYDHDSSGHEIGLVG